MKRERLDCPYDFTSRCTMGRCDCKPKEELPIVNGSYGCVIETKKKEVNKMKQTAVEYLIEELNEIKSSSTDQYGKITFFEDEFIRVLDKAKEMKKKQQGYSEEDIEKAFKVGFTLGYGSDVEAIDEKDKCFNRWFKIFKNK